MPRFTFLFELLCGFRAFTYSFSYNYWSASPIGLILCTDVGPKFLHLQKKFQPSRPSPRGATRRLARVFILFFHVTLLFANYKATVGHAVLPPWITLVNHTVASLLCYCCVSLSLLRYSCDIVLKQCHFGHPGQNAEQQTETKTLNKLARSLAEACRSFRPIASNRKDDSGSGHRFLPACGVANFAQAVNPRILITWP